MAWWSCGTPPAASASTFSTRCPAPSLAWDWPCSRPPARSRCLAPGWLPAVRVAPCACGTWPAPPRLSWAASLSTGRSMPCRSAQMASSWPFLLRSAPAAPPMSACGTPPPAPKPACSKPPPRPSRPWPSLLTAAPLLPATGTAKCCCGTPPPPPGSEPSTRAPTSLSPPWPSAQMAACWPCRALTASRYGMWPPARASAATLTPTLD